MRFLGLLLISFIVSTSIQAKSQSIVYLPSWINWELDTINLEGVDEVKVAFFPISSSKKLMNGISSSESSFDEFIQRVKDLKTIYPDLKVSISVGGGTYSPKDFSNVVKTKEGREVLIKSISDKLIETNFDGVSIDWEYPKSSKDKKNFKLLLKELKEELTSLEAKNKKNYLLSYSIPNHSWIARFIDLKNTVNYVDYIEVMAYDLVGGYSSKTGHNANLYKSSKDIWSTETTIKYLLSIKVPSNKIVTGIPFYGIRFDNVKKEGDGLYNSIEVTKPSIVKYLSYSQIKTYYLSDKNYKKFKSLDSNSSYLFNIEDGRFITFLDNKEVEKIAEYSVKNNLYGVMLWTIWQDDGKLSLFKSVTSALD